MSKKLKVLFCTATYSGGGGSERVLTVLANNLPKDWDVDILEIIAFNIKKENVRKDINLLPYLVWHGHRTRFKPLFIHVLSHHPEIIKAFRRLYGYDVVVGWMAVEGVSLLPSFPESKTIAWFHNNIDFLKKFRLKPDADIECYTGMYRNKRLFSILAAVTKSADALVGVSKMCQDSITSVYPEQKSKTSIIYNGTDIKELQKMSSGKIANAEIATLYDKLVKVAPVLICVGHICTRKNFVLAVRSLEILKQKNIACNLVIIGSPSSQGEEDELQKVINECNIQDNVFLLGYQNNPLPFVARAKLLLMTSLDEGFPTVVTEAMALGVPFVTTPVEGASDELFDEGRCGLLADWDEKDYASKIETLLKDEELYQSMSCNCREHVKRYSVENYVASLEKLINHIPEKNKDVCKRQNIVIATLLFIFYVAFHSSYKNPRTSYVAKARFDYLKKHWSLWNLVKLFYRASIFAVNILCFPLLIMYSSILVLTYRKRLFC